MNVPPPAEPMPLWRRVVIRLALAAFRIGGWLARRAGLGVTLAIRWELARCPHGRTIGNGYTCRECTP